MHFLRGLKNTSVAARIFGVMALLALTAALVGWSGLNSARIYSEKVAEMQAASERAILGEQVNGLINAVVMDSRGIYMSRDAAEAEKYAPLILKNVAEIRRLMEVWTSLLPESERQSTTAAAARAAEFASFRTELVRLGRESSVAEARAYGDNDVNRANRQALNKEVEALAAANTARVSEVTQGLGGFYDERLRAMIWTAVLGLAA